MNRYLFIAEMPYVGLGNRVDLKSISPLLRNTAIEQSSDGELQIEVAKLRTWPENLALSEAESEVDELLDRLALFDNHRILSVRYKGFIDEQGQFHASQGKRGFFGTPTAIITSPSAFYECEQQRKVLAGKINPGLARLHRTAQGMPDGIGKFLLLYGALLVMHGETQAKVDDYLLRERPDILMVQGKHRYETIVSHIRNQIAHPEDNIDVQTLAHQAKTYCHVLIGLVRSQIIENIR